MQTLPINAHGFVVPIATFLERIGLRIEWGEVPGDTFLPGILLVRGGLRICRIQLKYPGDLLHEAGHLAGLTEEERQQDFPVVSTDGGMEMMALAWSYAAAVEIGVPLEVLFHPDGYKGGATNLIENFAAGRHIGVPMLQYFGLAYEPRFAAERGVPPFPQMQCWLRP